MIIVLIVVIELLSNRKGKFFILSTQHSDGNYRAIRNIEAIIMPKTRPLTVMGQGAFEMNKYGL